METAPQRMSASKLKPAGAIPRRRSLGKAGAQKDAFDHSLLPGDTNVRLTFLCRYPHLRKKGIIMHRWNLILTVLLTGVLFASVAEADENGLFVQITSLAPEMTSAKATSDCNAMSAEFLPLAHVIFAGGLGEEVCGQCGAPYCWGAQLYAPCGNDGRQCIPSGICGANIPRCYCLRNP